MRVLKNAFFAIGWQIAILNTREIKYDCKKFRIIRTIILTLSVCSESSLLSLSSGCFSPSRIDAVASSNLPYIGSSYFLGLKLHTARRIAYSFRYTPFL